MEVTEVLQMSMVRAIVAVGARSHHECLCAQAARVHARQAAGGHVQQTVGPGQTAGAGQQRSVLVYSVH